MILSVVIVCTCGSNLIDAIIDAITDAVILLALIDAIIVMLTVALVKIYFKKRHFYLRYWLRNGRFIEFFTTT